MKKGRVGLTIGIIVILVLISGFSRLVRFITDYMWFKELGYTSVFLKQLFTQLQIGVPLFVVLALLGILYLHLLKRGYFKKVPSASPPAKPRTLTIVSLALSLGASAIITIMAVNSIWFEALKFTNSTEFSLADPIFGLDVSFYVFRLQFITQLNQIVISVVIAFALLAVIYYFTLISMCRPKIFETVRPEQSEAPGPSYSGDPLGDMFGKFGDALNRQMGGGARPGPQKAKTGKDGNWKELLGIASSQVTILGVIFFLMVGVNFFLRQYDLLYSQTGVLYGAGFTDVSVTLWVYRAMIVLSVAAAVFFVIGIRKRRYRTVLTVPVIMIVIGALGSGAAMVVQNLIVSPDEITKESEYLAYNIDFTQRAYDLQDVQTKPFAADNTLTSEDILNNTETLSNIRINDYTPAKLFYNNTQTLRNYYSFYDVDVDRYMVNGAYTQTFISAREVDGSLIQQEWINKYLKYTHGYGITLSRVDKVTASGQPDIMIKNIPPVSDVEEIEITRPEIYFGELTNDYVLVNTDEMEYDYPDGDENAWTLYEGNAGIKLGFLSKSLFAIREQTLKLLVSTNINSDSRIVINRNISQRVRAIMPYLSYADDPYIVTIDGRLYWIIDAFTTSSKFPYSEPYSPTYSSVNYIRNSVKVVVDAYNGDVSYYLVDDRDPVANTYMSIYPKLFKPFDAMPDELRAHIRYPGDLLNIQAGVYKRYHVDDVAVFYQGEDIWDISRELLEASDPVPMTPQYYVMKLPGESEVEFINSIPYTPRNKKNLTGLFVARNDGEHYGELILYQLPKSKLVYGPEQIEAQIDQNDTIAKEFSLWKNSGSTYTRGNMFIIPIEESLVYVEPVYLAAASASLPEVRRVIVAYGDRIAYESTLSAALDSLFGSGSLDAGGGADSGEAPDDGATDGLSFDELALRANEAYENAISAQRDGDWAAYGRELDSLERYLTQMLPPEDVQDGLDDMAGATPDASSELYENVDTIE